MKTRIIFFFSAIFFCSVLGWGQTFKITETMSATLDKEGVMKVTTTAKSEDMPDFEWIGTPWYENNGLIHEVVIEDNITSIGNLAFHHCVELKSVSMANSVTSIGEYSFYNCYLLASVTLSEKLTSIRQAAFQKCSNLTVIEIPALVSVVSVLSFFECSKLTTINVHADNTFLSSKDGVLYNKDKTTVYIYPEGKDDKSFEIPGTVETIAWSAFCASKFETVTIPNSVKEIGSGAFNSNTNLTSITLPKSVTMILNNAFEGCTGLTDVTVGWATPLEVPGDIFDKVNTSAVTLHVPKGTTALYKAADAWESFKIVDDAPTGNVKMEVPTLKAFASNGVLNITGLQPGKPLYVYTISGQLIYQGIAKSEEETIPLGRHGVCLVVSGEQSVKVFQ
jgi:hypothetical protein